DDQSDHTDLHDGSSEACGDYVQVLDSLRGRHRDCDSLRVVHEVSLTTHRRPYRRLKGAESVSSRQNRSCANRQCNRAQQPLWTYGRGAESEEDADGGS
ncbi:hypothetical protein GBF38_009275, partial [Nibea albiflora]